MVNVRKKKNIQTPLCHLSGGLSDLQLNKREESASVADLKTLSNPSRGSRKLEGVLGPKASHNGIYSPEHSARCKKQDVVFVLDRNGKPLMPTKSGKARRMLDSGIAKVVRKTPFTIKMLIQTCEYKQKIQAGMDTGARFIGVAAKLGQSLIYLAQVELRAREIKGKMEQRAMYRRTRRGRKTRYRPARFLNRSASTKEGRLPPSVKHIVQSHLRERDSLHKILPQSHVRWHLELASFDIHKITNPNVIDYRKGNKYGFENAKAYVLFRDNHTCQCCSGKSDDQFLEVHHIVFRSNGGTDSPDNLVTLCGACHKKIHAHENAEKESLKLQKKKQSETKSATHVSIAASQLRKHFGPFAEEFGYETKIKRKILGIKKTHYSDAAVICSAVGEVIGEENESVFYKKLVSKGDYQQTKGPRLNIKIPTGKIFGFRKFDLLKTVKGIGFVKGKRSSGYFAIADVHGCVISGSVNVKKAAKRLSARKVALIFKMEERFLPAVNDGVSALVD